MCINNNGNTFFIIFGRFCDFSLFIFNMGFKDILQFKQIWWDSNKHIILNILIGLRDWLFMWIFFIYALLKWILVWKKIIQPIQLIRKNYLFSLFLTCLPVQVTVFWGSRHFWRTNKNLDTGSGLYRFNCNNFIQPFIASLLVVKASCGPFVIKLARQCNNCLHPSCMQHVNLQVR